MWRVALALTGCSRIVWERPPVIATDVRWTEDGVETPLEDARAWLVTASASDGACEPSVQIGLHALSGRYTMPIDLAAYSSGARVLTPEPPYELRLPTLFRADIPTPTFWTGGPASFRLDADGAHAVTLDAPWRCPDGPDACVVSAAVTLAFTVDPAALVEEACTAEVDGAEGTAPSGLPYCVYSGSGAVCPIDEGRARDVPAL
jgi:hypothetical protein